MKSAAPFSHTTALLAKRRTKVNFGRQKESSSSSYGNDNPASSSSSQPPPSAPVDPTELARKVALADARKNYMKTNSMSEEQMKSEEIQLLKQVTGTSQGDLMGEIEGDIAKFRKREEDSTNGGSVVGSVDDDENVGGFNFGDLIAKILVADLALVLVFLVWFIAAAVTQQQGNPYLLERFQDIFAPVVQPALGVLMIGSIASGIADKGNDNDGPKS